MSLVGSQINFAYGAGMLTADRFLQDYGFLDAEVGGWVQRHVCDGLTTPVSLLSYTLASVRRAGQHAVEG